MPRKRHTLTPFSLSFLDSMSCGLGAVVLLFLIIKHNVEAKAPVTPVAPALAAEVNLLETEVLEGKEGLAVLRNTVADVDHERVIAEGLARRIMEQIRETEGESAADRAKAAADELAALRAQVEALEAKKKQLSEESKSTGEDTRAFSGEGTRQYLTGLKIGGERILVLLDASASMLDKSLVNVIRRKNMPDTRKANSAKWRQAINTVDWLSARFPVASHYQIYTFNTAVKSAVPGTEGTWLKVNELAQLNKAIDAVKQTIPDGGTSLETAFRTVRELKPAPDNVYLITDGLPTQGQKPPLFGTKVSGKERVKLFNSAIQQLPDAIPMNVILLPMEGDPAAAHAFWGLAIAHRGSFLSPAEDWP